MMTVNTSTPMKPSMQMLCRLLDQVTIRGLWFGVVFCLSSWSAVAAVPATPAAALQKLVIEWVVQTQSVAPEAVVLLTGVAEIAGALGLIQPFSARLRRWAAWPAGAFTTT